MEVLKTNEFNGEKIIVQFKYEPHEIHMVTSGKDGYTYWIVNEKTPKGKKKIVLKDLGAILEKIPHYWG